MLTMLLGLGLSKIPTRVHSRRAPPGPSTPQSRAVCSHGARHMGGRAQQVARAPAPAKHAANNILDARALLAPPKPASPPGSVQPALQRLQSELQLKEATHLADVFGAMVLSECIYKAVDVGHERASGAIQKLGAALPVNPRLFNVQWSPEGQRQRYIMAETPDAIHVSFLGTKVGRDHLSNLDLRYQPMPLSPPAFDAPTDAPFGTAEAATGSGFSSLPNLGSATDKGSGSGGRQQGPAAHRGYALRAAGVPLEQMYRLASVAGKRLVLSGHSLGGAIATLSTVRLLSALPPHLHHTVTCIGFATPPVGNTALVEAVEGAGWNEHITNYTLPEDWVPGALALWASTHAPPGTTPSKAQQAQQAAQQAQQEPSSAPSSAPSPAAAHGCVCCGHWAPSLAWC